MLKTKFWLFFRLAALGIEIIASLFGRIWTQPLLSTAGHGLALALYLILFAATQRDRRRRKRTGYKPSSEQDEDLREIMLRMLDWLIAFWFLIGLLRGLQDI